MRIVFFGSDRIALPTLERLAQKHEMRLVCCPDRPPSRARGTIQWSPLETKSFALRHDIPIDQVPVSEGFRLPSWKPEFLLNQSFDFGVVVSFGYRLPPWILSRFTRGVLNMHPSLLPRFRGPAPIPRCIESGESLTGVSVIQVHPDVIDSGKIFLQREIVRLA